MCDAEPLSCQTTTTRTARKAHRCCECGGAIVAGRKYQYISGIADGCGVDFKTCLECVDLRTYIYTESEPDECTPAFCELIAHAIEHDYIPATRRQ